MSNRMKMVQKELLFTLFSRNWSGSKINKLMGLHLLTIRRYQKEWQKRPADRVSDPASVKVLSYSRESCPDTFQSVPPREKEVPTEEVVHFQWFTGPEGTDQKTISKSKASVYHEIIHRKLQRGQHARSIYQDLVDEEHFNGSYD